MDPESIQYLNDSDSQFKTLSDKYEVIRQIGKGAYGIVWLVREKRTREKFVAKEISTVARGASGKSRAEVAANEIKILARMSHECIIRYVDCFEEVEKMYIIMEYASGGDLRRLIKHRKAEGKPPFPEDLIIPWLIQILLAMKYIHACRILHRDIKAANMFLTSTGAVKIGDFGLTKALGGGQDSTATICGTPLYFSPEMASKSAYGMKSDMWAVGCLVYEMMTLEHPFPAENVHQIYERIINVDYKDPDPHGSYSNELKAILRCLFEKDESRRASATDILNLPWMKQQMDKFREGVPATIGRVLKKEASKRRLKSQSTPTTKKDSSPKTKDLKDKGVEDVLPPPAPRQGVRDADPKPQPLVGPASPDQSPKFNMSPFAGNRDFSTMTSDSRARVEEFRKRIFEERKRDEEAKLAAATQKEDSQPTAPSQRSPPPSELLDASPKSNSVASPLGTKPRVHTTNLTDKSPRQRSPLTEPASPGPSLSTRRSATNLTVNTTAGSPVNSMRSPAHGLHYRDRMIRKAPIPTQSGSPVNGSRRNTGPTKTPSPPTTANTGEASQRTLHGRASPNGDAESPVERRASSKRMVSLGGALPHVGSPAGAKSPLHHPNAEVLEMSSSSSSTDNFAHSGAMERQRLGLVASVNEALQAKANGSTQSDAMSHAEFARWVQDRFTAAKAERIQELLRKSSKQRVEDKCAAFDSITNIIGPGYATFVHTTLMTLVFDEEA